VALSKHFTQSGPLSGFPYYNLRVTPWRGLSLSTTRGRAEQLCGCEPWELSSSVGVSLGNWAALWVWALETLTSPQKVRVVLVDWSLTVISDLGQLYVRYILPISQYLLINKVGSLETAFNNVWDHSNIRSFASPFLPPDFCSVSDMIAYMFPQWILWKTTWVRNMTWLQVNDLWYIILSVHKSSVM
jgi:hypothetical protein